MKLVRKNLHIKEDLWDWASEQSKGQPSIYIEKLLEETKKSLEDLDEQETERK